MTLIYNPGDDDNIPSELNYGGPTRDRQHAPDAYMSCGCWEGGPCPHQPAPPAKWYLHAVIGRDVPGGTETSEIDAYVTSESKPSAGRWARNHITGTGWRVLESSATRAT